MRLSDNLEGKYIGYKVSSKRPVLLKDHYLLTISEKAKHTVLFNYLLTGSVFFE